MNGDREEVQQETPVGDTSSPSPSTAPAQQAEQVSPLQWFHSRLIEDQSQGVVRGLPESYSDFEYAFQDRDYRSQLHRYLQSEQRRGNIRGIPGTEQEFTDKFAPGLAPMPDPSLTNIRAQTESVAGVVRGSAESATRGLSLLDVGLSVEQVEAMQQSERMEADLLTSLGNAGAELRAQLNQVRSAERKIYEVGDPAVDESDRGYLSGLRETASNLRSGIGQVYSSLKGEEDRLNEELQSLYVDEPLPSYAGEGTMRVLPQENEEPASRIKEKIAVVQGEMDKLDLPVSEKVQHAVNSFISTGLAEIPAGLLEGIATWSMQLENMVKAVGEKAYEQPVGRLANTVSVLLASDPERAQEVKDLATYEMAQNIRGWAQETWPSDPALQDRFVWTVLPAATGSMIGYAAGGLSTRLVGGSAGAFALLSASGAGAGQAYTEAKAFGASEADAQVAGRWGMIPGAVQVLPVLKILERMDMAAAGALRGGMREVIREGLATSWQEALVEAAGQAGFDIIARNIYDQERSYLESLDRMGQSGAAGGAAGFISGVLFGALGRAAAPAVTRRDLREPATAQEEGVLGEPQPFPGAEAVGDEAPMSIEWDSSAPFADQIAEVEGQIEILEAVRSEMEGDTAEFDQFIAYTRRVLSDLEARGNLELRMRSAMREDDVDSMLERLTDERGMVYFGAPVHYLGERGILRQDQEGTFVVEREDGSEVEVEGVMKDGSVPLSDAGITPGPHRVFRMSEEDPSVFSVQTEDLQSGEISSQTLTLDSVNQDVNGNPVSVTMRLPDGQQRTYRQSDIVEQVLVQQFQRQSSDMAAELSAALDAEMQEGDPTPGVPIPERLAQMVRLDDGDPRLDPVFAALDTGAPLSPAQAEAALEWVEGKIDQIQQADPPNAADLLDQLSIFEAEVIDYATSPETAQPDMGEQPAVPGEAPVFEFAPTETAQPPLPAPPRGRGPTAEYAPFTSPGGRPGLRGPIGLPGEAAEGGIGIAERSPVERSLEQYWREAQEQWARPVEQQYLEARGNLELRMRSAMQEGDVSSMLERLTDERGMVDVQSLPNELRSYGERMNSVARRLETISRSHLNIPFEATSTRPATPVPTEVETSLRRGYAEVSSDPGAVFEKENIGVDYLVTRREDGDYFAPYGAISPEGSYTIQADPAGDGLIMVQEGDESLVSAIPLERYTGFDSLESAIELQREVRQYAEPPSPQMELMDMAYDQLGWAEGTFYDNLGMREEGRSFPSNAELTMQQYREAVREYVSDAPALNEMVTDAMIDQWYDQQMLFSMTQADFNPNQIGSLNEHAVLRESLGRTRARLESDPLDPDAAWPEPPVHPESAPPELAPTEPPIGETRMEQLEDLYARRRAEFDALSREMMELSFGDLRMGIDPRMVAMSARIIAKGAQLGYVRFQQFAQHIADTYGQDFWRNIYDSFRTSYIAARRREGNPYGEDLDALSEMTAEDVLAIPPETGETAEGVEAVVPEGEQPQLPEDFLERPELGAPLATLEAAEANRMVEPNFYARIPGITDSFSEAYFRSFLGAAEVFKRVPGLAHLGRAIDYYVNQREENLGFVYQNFGQYLERATGRDLLGLRASWAELMGKLQDSPENTQWESWAVMYDRGTIDQAESAYDALSPELQELADAWVSIADQTYQQMSQAGVLVYDPAIKGYRPIGQVQRYFPRKRKPEIDAVLRDPTSNPQKWAEVVDILVKEGFAENEVGAQQYVSQQETRRRIVEGDYFSGMEMARQKGFPASFYDHSMATALEYLTNWSERQAQIEAFGQSQAPGEKGSPSGDIFDRAIAGVASPETREYIEMAQEVIYGERARGTFSKIGRTLNMTATAGLLANPRTGIALNFVGGQTLNLAFYGRDAIKAYRGVLDSMVDMDVKHLGIWKSDQIRLLDEGEKGFGWRALQSSTSLLLEAGSYGVTERFIRKHAYLSASSQLNSAIDAWSRSGFESREGRYWAAYFGRQGFEPSQIMREVDSGQTLPSGRVTGPEINRWYRAGVNLTQGSYMINQVPLWTDRHIGRFGFKFWKFSNQLSRAAHHNVISPIYRAALLREGESYYLTNPRTGEVEAIQYPRTKAVFDGLNFMAWMTGGGLSYSVMAGFMSGFLRPGPTWEELEKALAEDEDILKSFGLAMEMSLEAFLSIGGIGVLQFPYMWGRDFHDRVRASNPLDPAGLNLPKQVIGSIVRMVDQAPNVDVLGELRSIMQRTFSLPREMQRMSMYGVSHVMEEFYQADLEVARRDVNYTRHAARRFAKQEGIVGQRINPGMYGATTNSRLNRVVSEALIAGHVGRAVAAIENALEEEPERREQILRSLQAYVRSRQPALVRGAPSEAMREEFLRWVEENYSERGQKRIFDLDRRYREGARELGLMN